MTKLLISLAACGVALIASQTASQAQAADTVVTREYYAEPAPVVENIRTLCDRYGRCWRERTRTIVEREAYDYAPPAVVEQRVYRRPAYYVERPATYYRAPSAGVGVTAPGVSVGVGLESW